MKSWLVLATVALFVFAWMFRYDVYEPAKGSMVIYKHDRWTGHVYFLHGKELTWQRVDEPAPAVEPAIDLLQKPAKK